MIYIVRYDQVLKTFHINPQSCVAHFQARDLLAASIDFDVELLVDRKVSTPSRHSIINQDARFCAYRINQDGTLLSDPILATDDETLFVLQATPMLDRRDLVFLVDAQGLTPAFEA